jgi:hypothetical protein
LAAIKAARSAFRAGIRAYTAMDNAIADAKAEHGQRPSGLIRWRRYGAIGDSEIERARNEFLCDAITAAERRKIESEYRDARLRYAAAVCACAEWGSRCRRCIVTGRE